MEEIYTVRVKWRPDPGLSFPSERAYSSSTVGGLATAHLVLAALALTLSSLGYATAPWRGEFFGGVSLVFGAVVAGGTGLLAWRKWYVDRHIRWFFCGSLVSCLGSSISAILTAILLLLPPPGSTSATVPPIDDPINSTVTTFVSPIENASDINNNTTIGPPMQLLEGRDGEVGELRQEIYVHLFLAALVELVWSMLSVRLAWKGSKAGKKREDGPGGKVAIENGRPLPQHQIGFGGRPDILQNVRKEDPRYADVVKELCRLQKGGGGGPEPSPPSGLPLPESRQEYGQRMERFLSGVATLS